MNEDKKIEYLNKFYDAYWKENIDLSNQENINKVLEILNIDTSIYLKGINDQRVKDELKKLTSEAYNKEIFGAPTFIYRDKIFWGQDRLEYAIDEFLN